MYKSSSSSGPGGGGDYRDEYYHHPGPAPPPRRTNPNNSNSNRYYNNNTTTDDEKGEGSEIYVVDYVASNQHQGRSYGRGDFDDDDRDDDMYRQQHVNSSMGPPPPSLHPPPPSSSSYYHAGVKSSSAGGAARPPSSMLSTTSSRNKRNVTVETMAAPNPCCPRGTSRSGVCCLLLLVNLGLILVTLGFSIVLQLTDIPFVWWCGLLFLVVGFVSLVSALVFCVEICRRHRYDGDDGDSREVYWTHLWSKRF